MEIEVHISLLMVDKTTEQEQKLASLLNELSQKYCMGFIKKLNNQVDEKADSIFKVWIKTPWSREVVRLISQLDHPAISPTIIIDEVKYNY